MTQHSPHHSPMDLHGVDSSKRPKGILKNASHSSPPKQTSPTSENALQPVVSTTSTENSLTADRPSLPGREMSEKEIVLANTLQNAGHRRSSSAARTGSFTGPPSRRQSGHAPAHGLDSNSPRLKWDEANLYLTEQERGHTMKITEPKTPFAKQYDPAEDEDEVEAIDAQNLLVDELDKAKSSGSLGADEAAGEHRPKGVKEDEIPGLDIGEPELLRSGNHGTPESEKRVIVDAESGDDVVGATHGEVPPNVSAEELEKHRRFEERRRKHYEMKDVKGLLGHPESIPDDEDEDEADGGVPPPMPKLPDSVRQ